MSHVLTGTFLSVFQCSRSGVFCHVTAMFVNMPFNKVDCIVIKKSHLLKEYTAQKLLKEFPSKSWNKQSFWRLLKT